MPNTPKYLLINLDYISIIYVIMAIIIIKYGFLPYIIV